MKALILNSGMGSRMGSLTQEHPKCMTEVAEGQSIISRQLQQIAAAGIKDVVMTTGRFDEVLMTYCKEMDLPLNFTFVKNPIYDQTQYIYSIYCARECLDDDILLMHGDLVFEDSVLAAALQSDASCMIVSSTIPLPEKDFKAVIHDGKIVKVGIEFFDDAVAAQPLYKLLRADWQAWLKRIVAFCEGDQVRCYAENALNEIAEQECNILPLDVQDELCAEIDNVQDLEKMIVRLREIND